MKTKKLILGLALLTVSILSFSQTAPEALSVQILGSGLYNSTPNPDQTTVLTGFYDYYDQDGDPEGISTYQWYRNGSPISGATAKKYTMTVTDIGANITFKVTPVSTVAPTTGSAVTSGVIIGASTIYIDANVSGITESASNNRLNLTMNNNTTYTVTGTSTVVTIWGEFNIDGNNGITINVLSGASLIVKGDFTTKNNVIINVDAGSSFIIESGLNAKNGTDLTINGTMDVTGGIAVEQNATFTVTTGGSLDVTGDVSFGTNGTMNIDGVVTITGDLTGAAVVSGDGTVIVGGYISSSITDLGPLPIELNYFHINNNQNIITITWQTATEENNDFFTLERSSDAVNYEIVATIPGAGNSKNVLNYSYIDKFPLTGKSYYRLMQTDFNGKSKTFEPVSTTFFNEKAVQLSPMPTTNLLNVAVDGSMGNASLRIINMQGSIVWDINQLDNKITIDVSSFPKGAYILTIEREGSRYVKQFIIKH